MTEQDPSIGQIIDGLGCKPTLKDGDLVAGAVTVMKVVEPDGSVRLSICWNEGMSWLERIGMLRAAEHMDLPDYTPAEED
jgi:hypothetical protein